MLGFGGKRRKGKYRIGKYRKEKQENVEKQNVEMENTEIKNIELEKEGKCRKENVENEFICAINCNDKKYFI